MREARRLSCLSGLGPLLAALLFAAPGRAQTSNPLLAESLYQEAKQLFIRKDFAGACPKLAESDRLDPAGGTVLMLGECYEGEGKIASACAAYGEAIARAQRDRRPDREKEARTRFTALTPRVPRLVIEVPDEIRAVAGLVVKSAGVTVPSVSFGIAIFADPGAIEVSAAAPGHASFRAIVTVSEGQTGRLRISPLPLLPPEPSAPLPAALPPPPPPARSSAAVPVAFALGGLGVAALTVGGYFGVVAIRDAHAVRDRCHGASTCSDLGAVNLAHSADTEANAANVTLPLGAAALVSGVIVFLVSGRRKEARPALRFTPRSADGPGLTISGVF